jgi:hypothetical protein
MVDTKEFRTVEDMQSVPLEKLGMFCEDLRLWLSLHRLSDAEKDLRITSPRDVFGWIDDGRHDLKISLSIKQATE